MKLVLFQQSDAGPQLPGLLTDRGVVDISGAVRSSYTPQLVMEGIIDDFEQLRPTLEKLAQTATALPMSSVRLRAPLPRPHKILCALANYWEHAQRAPRPLNMFMKNPDAVIVRLWNDGQLRHNYNTDDMEHRVPELIEFATTVMTMLSGDIIACGTNHEGLGALQDGETVEIEIQGIGRMSLKVADPLKRSWERGIYMGADSTNPEAVKRHRPRGHA